MANVIDILIKAQDAASGVMGNVAKAADKMGMSFDKSVGASNAAAAGLGLVATAAAGFIGYGTKIAGDLEASRAGFITLLGSAEKADKALATIKRDAKNTPFELPGLIAANQLLTSVTKNADQSETMLMNVGKALTAMGKGQPELDRIIVNLQQIGAVGKASLMDIRQFAFAGIPIFEMLTEATGKTGEELSNFISEGGVTFEVLEEMFNKAGTAGGRFADAFANQAGGFNQLWANMSDSVTIAAAEIVQQTGIFDMIKLAVKGVIDYISDHQQDIVNFVKNSFKWIADNGAMVAGILAGLLAPAVMSLVGSFLAGTVALAPWILAFTALALGADALQKKMGGWDKLLSEVVRIFEQGRLGVRAFFAAFSEGDVTSDGFVGWMERAGVAVRQMWETAKPVVLFIGGAFRDAFADLWKIIAEKLWPALVKLQPLWEALGYVVGVVLVGAFMVMIAQLYVVVKVVSFVIDTFANLLSFLGDFIKNTGGMFADLVGHIVNAWNGITDGIKVAIDGAKVFIDEFITSLTGIWNGIVSAAQAAWSYITDTIIKPQIDFIVGAANIVGNVFKYIWQWITALAALAWSQMQPIIQPVIDWITAAVKSVGDFIATVWNGVSNGARVAWQNVSNFLRPVIDDIRNKWQAFTGFVGSLFNSIGNTGRNIFGGFNAYIGSVVNDLRNKWQGFSNFMGGIWNTISNGAGGIGRAIANAVGGAMEGMKGAIRSSINWVIDRINNMIDAVNGVADKVPGAPKLGRVARLANGTQNWGGGVALVGERGPELVNMPAGSQVYSATRTANALRQTEGGGGVRIDKIEVNNNVDVGLVIRQLGWELATR